MENTLKKEPEFKEDFLEIILNESRDLRSQQLSLLNNISESISNILNFLMVMLGIYISTILLISDSKLINIKLDLINIFTLLFSLIFILIAIIRCLVETLTTVQQKIPSKGKVYSLLEENEKRDLLLEIIKTYLNEYENFLIQGMEKHYLRIRIIVLAFASIFEFLLFAFINIIKTNSLFYSILSGTLLILVIFLYYFITRFEENMLIKLKNELNELN